MSSEPRRSQRKAEIAALKEGGRKAFQDGKSSHSNPWKPFHPNYTWWLFGYDAARIEAREAGRVTLSQAFDDWFKETYPDYASKGWDMALKNQLRIAFEAGWAAREVDIREEDV